MVLPARQLPGTEIVTSAFGFGCAGLFRIPGRSDRRLVLDAAYDAGIRHFDVAPMYGLGLAEGELAPFLRQRQDVTVTTKFGIVPTFLARRVGRIQDPFRALLAKRPDLGEGLKAAGQGPRSGPLGRALYSSPGYHRQSARRGLELSLRALGTECIDVFLLHDPVGDLIANARELSGYLDEECRRGRIRSWGVTGPPSVLASVLGALGRADVLQFRDDIFEKPLGATPVPAATITYGALTRALPAVRRFLARSPGAAAEWSDRLGTDLTAGSGLPRMLLSAALQRNAAGPVLFSTTRPDRARVAAQAAARDASPLDGAAAAFGEFIDAIRAARPELIPAP